MLKFLLCVFLLATSHVSAQLSIGLGVNVGGVSVGVGAGGSASMTGALDIVTTTSLMGTTYVPVLTCANGATLQVPSGVQLTCGAVELSSGNVAMESSPGGGSAMIVQGACTTTPGSSNTVSGGAVSTQGSNAVVAPESGSVLTMSSTALSPCMFQLVDQAVLNLESCLVNEASAVQGTAASLVNIVGGRTQCNAQTVFAAPTRVTSGGELMATDSGAVNVADMCELTLMGGKLSCSGACASGSEANVVVGSASGAGGALACRGSAVSQHAGGVVELLGQSQHIVEQGSTHQFTSPTVMTGSGSSAVAGTMHAASTTVVCNHAATSIASTGKMMVTGTGQFVLSAGHTLTNQGALVCQNVGSSSGAVATQNTHVVGCDTCGVRASIEHVGQTTVSAGHNFLLKASGMIHVTQGSTCTYTGATKTSGAGSVLVEGALVHMAQYTSSSAHTVTGSHVINAANACSFGSLTYGNAAALTMKAGSAGYTAAHVAGQAVLAGTLHLQSGSYKPPSSVTLLNCGSTSGQFASATSDSSTAKGQIHFTPTSVVWYPYATGACTNCCLVA